jgi:glucosylglycerol 3-phosphatase
MIARRLRGRFFVLTNGEHIGRRGVNRIVDTALGDAARARREGCYLPGLAGGGVQWQDASGQVSHPGVSEAELAFLATVPAAARSALGAWLAANPFALPDAEIAPLLDTCVLDNAVSPTLNLNHLYQRYREQPERVA